MKSPTPQEWRKTAKGVYYDRYHPPVYRPRGEGINKRANKDRKP